MLGALFTLFLLGIAGVIALGMIMAVVGFVFSITFGIVGFLLFRVAPILLVGWVVLKLVNRVGNRHRISAADQKWLDGE